MSKPRTFIGSSSERLEVARELARYLKPGTDVVPWDTSVPVGSYTLDAILDKAGGCDFGVFVFAPDDVLYSRSQEFWATRDNVVFELGLFMGRLGRERALLVVPKVDGHRMLTDLLGLTYVTYEPEGANRAESLRKAAKQLLTSMSAHGAVRHTGWNEILWLRHELELIPATAKLSVLSVLERFAKRNRDWRESEVEKLMSEVARGRNTGRAAANSVFFALFWCGIVVPKDPFQDRWFDPPGTLWNQFSDHVHFSDRGLVLLNQLRR